MIEPTHCEIVEVERANSVAGCGNCSTQSQICGSTGQRAINRYPFTDIGARRSIVIEDWVRCAEPDVLVFVDIDVPFCKRCDQLTH